MTLPELYFEGEAIGFIEDLFTPANDFNISLLLSDLSSLKLGQIGIKWIRI